MSKKLSLAEMIGKTASNNHRGLKLSQLGEILGDSMPELPRNQVGRHRLIRALQQRFGLNFRSLPGVKNLVKEFDDDLAFEDKIKKVQAIRYRKPEVKRA